MLVFFFKQKTAYEMRISDWSSDVLLFRSRAEEEPRCRCSETATGCAHQPPLQDAGQPDQARRLWPDLDRDERGRLGNARLHGHGSHRRWGTRPRQVQTRSEEHTSELQSLMRISYAVFCLKKKTKYM